MCVRVFLAEDAEIVRRAIRNLLNEHEEIKIVGEAATFPEVLQKATELKPDLIVLDLHMAGDGFSTQFPNGHKLLAISFANDDEAKRLGSKYWSDEITGQDEIGGRTDSGDSGTGSGGHRLAL